MYRYYLDNVLYDLNNVPNYLHKLENIPRNLYGLDFVPEYDQDNI